MDEKEMIELIKPVPVKVLKDEVKKRGLKLGRCPTKLDCARLLPEEVLRELSSS